MLLSTRVPAPLLSRVPEPASWLEIVAVLPESLEIVSVLPVSSVSVLPLRLKPLPKMVSTVALSLTDRLPTSVIVPVKPLDSTRVSVPDCVLAMAMASLKLTPSLKLAVLVSVVLVT